MSKSVPNFPDDWIAPGEFTFCGRCGRPESIVENNKYVGTCPVCVPPENESEEIAKRLKLHKERQQFAKKRKDADIPHMFWLGELVRRRNLTFISFAGEYKDLHEKKKL